DRLGLLDRLHAVLGDAAHRVGQFVALGQRLIAGQQLIERLLIDRQRGGSTILLLELVETLTGSGGLVGRRLRGGRLGGGGRRGDLLQRRALYGRDLRLRGDHLVVVVQCDRRRGDGLGL